MCGKSRKDKISNDIRETGKVAPIGDKMGKTAWDGLEAYIVDH